MLRRLHGSVLPHGSHMDLPLILGGFSPAPSPSHYCSLGYAGGERRSAAGHQLVSLFHIPPGSPHLTFGGLLSSAHPGFSPRPSIHGMSLKGRQLPDSQWAMLGSSAEEPWLTLPSAGLRLQQLQELQLKFHMIPRLTFMAVHYLHPPNS